MFERFTDRARQCVVLAQEQARLLNHNYIGTEHILLGLLAEEQGIAARALRQLGLSLEQVRAEVEEIIGTGAESPPGGHIPFTPRAKKVLELSLRESLQLGHNYIGTEHILLGIIREGEGVAAQVLVKRGADLARVRDQVIEMLSGRAVQPKNPQRTPGAEDVWTTAAALAAGGPVGTHHVLEALARSEGTLAANALGELGVDPDALAAKLEELGVEGTRDDTPEQSALRGMEVRLEADGLHVILSDADTLEKARAVLEEVGGDRLAGRDPVAAPLVGIWQATQRTLDGMRIRVEGGEETSGEGGSVSSAVRRAIEAQLRRLRARRPGQGEPPPTEGSG